MTLNDPATRYDTIKVYFYTLQKPTKNNKVFINTPNTIEKLNSQKQTTNNHKRTSNIFKTTSYIKPKQIKQTKTSNSQIQNTIIEYIINSNSTNIKAQYKHYKTIVTQTTQSTTTPPTKHMKHKNNTRKPPHKHTKHPIKRYKDYHVASAYRPRHKKQYASHYKSIPLNI